MHNNTVGFTHQDHKEAISEAQQVAKRMRKLAQKKEKDMKTIVLSDGTIVSSTSDYRLEVYKEMDKKILKIGY